MTEFNPPGWLQNAGTTHTAAQMRSYLNGLMAGALSSGSLVARGGVAAAIGNALLVTQTGSPSMAVVVKSGIGWAPGSENATQGCYGLLNDADATFGIAAAHASLSRIDLVCYKVQDSQYSGVANTSSIVVVTGTPAGSPTPPSAPANSLTLAQVLVGPAVVSIVNANITDVRRWLTVAGGMMVCTSTTRPAAGTVFDGQRIYETDTDKTYITHNSGTSWAQTDPPLGLVPQAYVPVWTAATTNPNLGNGTITGRYVTFGKLVFYSGEITMGSTTTYGSGNWQVSLPVTALSASPYVGSVLTFDASVGTARNPATFAFSTTTLGVFYSVSGLVSATVPITWAAGDVLRWFVVYEIP